MTPNHGMSSAKQTASACGAAGVRAAASAPEAAAGWARTVGEEYQAVGDADAAHPTRVVADAPARLGFFELVDPRSHGGSEAVRGRAARRDVGVGRGVRL